MLRRCLLQHTEDGHEAAEEDGPEKYLAGHPKSLLLYLGEARQRKAGDRVPKVFLRAFTITR